MRHDDLNNPRETLTPQEAVRLGNLRTIADWRIVEKINNYFYFKNKRYYVECPEYYTEKLLATVWNAGRIEGIRAERQRRNQTAQNYANKGA